jgi:hypothetical protein
VLSFFADFGFTNVEFFVLQNVEHIKSHLKKISKALHGMTKAMDEYCKETQNLGELLKNFSWTASADDKGTHIFCLLINHDKYFDLNIVK